MGLLDSRYQWPAKYRFKFIVTSDNLAPLSDLLEGGKLTTKPSKNGKYISVTYELTMNSSDEVVAIYKKASKIDGIISL